VVPAAFQKMSKPDAQLCTRAFREQARSYRFGGLREIFGVLKTCECNSTHLRLLIRFPLTDQPTMKFDLAYCLSLDTKLSIYDVRDLNFDETMAFDSAKEHFQCPNDACRSAFDAANGLGTFNAKNVNYVRTPHFKNLPSTRHVEGCPYVSLKAPASDVEIRCRRIG
jgi:hypothetical protein